MGKILKKFIARLAILVVVVLVGGFWYVRHIPSSPFDGAGQPEAMATLEQGEYIARASDCVACHSVPEGKPFAGGLEMGTPMGSIFATNITPDKETGIGNYTLAQFDNAVRRGVAADGHRLYPAMPYPSYAKLSDDDVKALYDYFMHHVEPVKQANKPTTIKWPLNQRWPLAFWNVAFYESGTYKADSSKDELWNRGAYLVQGPGHCGSCHTPRGPAMEEKALTEADNAYLSGALLDGWYAPSLRGDHNRGLGRWSEEDIATFLKTGRNQHGVVFGSMVDAFNNSTQYMSDNDLKAIAHYLKSLPGNDGDGTPWEYHEVSVAMVRPGEQSFMANCSFCHGRDGKGRDEWIPPLAGTTSMLSSYDESAINVVLNGSGRVVASGIPDAYRMPSFRDKLSDQQIADVLSFVRSSWGNNGPAVTVDDVKALREHTHPASPQPIILQMR